MNPTQNGDPAPRYYATLGPDYAPTAKLVVQVLKPADAPDFFKVVSEHGETLTVHRHKLKRL